MSSPPPRKLLIAAILLLVFAAGMAVGWLRVFPYTAAQALCARVAALFGADDPGLDPRGVWRRVQHDDRERTAGRETLAQLANNPYLRGTRSAPGVESVTIHDPDAAFDGLNLVVSAHAPTALLQDMKGNVLHRWRRDLADVWPGPLGFDEHPVHQTFWRRAHVFPNGDLLAIFEGIGMIKLDRDSNLIWAFKGRCHHDLFVDERGYIHTLTRQLVTDHDEFPQEGPILEDFITVLTPDGAEERRISVLRSFFHSDYFSWLTLAGKRGDILHTNTIELMDGRFASRHPLYARGNVLISVPTISAVAVIDPGIEKVVWAIGGLWSFQHQPTVLDDGNLLVFDNLGERGKSKVVEIDPLTQQQTWSWRGTPERPLSSDVLGSSQRLPNGNTLITESTAGRAIEVSRAGDIVWELISPYRAPDDDTLIATLLEVVRLDRAYFSADFTAAQNDYATGRRTFDLKQLDELIAKLKDD